MMDKLRMSLLSLLFIFFVGGCHSDTDLDEKGNTPPLPEEPEEDEKLELDGEAILSESIDVMSNVENYSIATNMNYYTSNSEKERLLENKYRSQTLVNLDPMRYYESSHMIKSEPGEDIERIHLQRYLTEDGFFMYDSMKDRWTEFPEEFFEDFRTYDTTYESPSYVLELVERDVSSLELSEGNEHYRLTFDGLTQEADQIASYMFQLIDADLATSMADMLYVSDMEKLDFEMKIDKESFYAKEVKMKLRFEVHGEETTPHYSDYIVVVHYDNFNHTEEVTIPENVLKEAEEMEIEEFSGFEEMKELEIMERFDIEELQDPYEEEAETTEDETEEKDGE
ncbi:hypothetical protein GJS40_13190 [Aliibacillus thermotolerans]|nr:DUF6612 family protein [Aliibacillus thermotolerans]MDA3130959.1 hypothetical protein [Aliibacillus thermotolerans]